MSFPGYSFACSRSRATGRTSRSTNSPTVSTMACSSVFSMLTGGPLSAGWSNDARGAQRGDVVVAAAEAAQDVVSVFAERRHRVHRRHQVGEVGRRQQGLDIAAGGGDLPPAVPPGQDG